jgi:hypothetical protein
LDSKNPGGKHEVLGALVHTRAPNALVFDVHAPSRQPDGGVKIVVRAAEGVPTTLGLVIVPS